MRIVILSLLFLFSLSAEVGTITFIKGDVFYLRDTHLKSAKVGMHLLKKDTIVTKSKSMAKLLLSDKSAISLGSNSKFSINDFLFDPKNKQAKADLQSNSGVFRVITGKISKLAPQRFKLKTKTMTIGIRGTIFSGIITNSSEKIFCEKGRIYVEANGLKQELSKGYQTQSQKGKGPAKPTRYTKKDIAPVHNQTKAWENKSCE